MPGLKGLRVARAGAGCDSRAPCLALLAFVGHGVPEQPLGLCLPWHRVLCCRLIVPQLPQPGPALGTQGRAGTASTLHGLGLWRGLAVHLHARLHPSCWKGLCLAGASLVLVAGQGRQGEQLALPRFP